MALKAEWLTPALIVSFACGGLGGAVFTWWVNGEPPLSVTYVISSTNAGGDATTSSLVPGLTLKIGERNVPAIHTHAVSLTRTGGYGDTLNLAVTFDRPTEVFGSSAVSPSLLHRMECLKVATGMTCVIGPLDGQGEYRIALATDNPSVPRVTAVGKDVEVESLEEISKNRDRDSYFGISALAVRSLGFALLALTVTMGVEILVRLVRVIRNKPSGNQS